jgi:signal transduction histidine kinase
MVFERFYPGDAARGAGLGLAIARELAERMHGRLRVSSASPGTAFTLELPTDGNGAS